MNPDFAILKSMVRSCFLQTINSATGEKLLMLDPDLRPFFRLMIGPVPKGTIKDTILLEPACIIDIDTPAIIFAFKPDVEKVRIVSKLISDLKTLKQIIVFVCPRYTAICKEIFEESHIEKLITVHEFPYELIPLEANVLTLDDNTSFSDLMLNRNFASLELVRDSLNRLEGLYGRIPTCYAKGAWSCMVYDSLLSNKDIGIEYPKTEIDGLIVLDRSLDLFTPLLTQMTYEGMVDEFYSVDCGTVLVDKKVTEPVKGEEENKGKEIKEKEAKEEEKISICLTGAEDILFEESRDKHFNIMKDFFPKKFEQMKSLCEKREDYKTLKEMREYISRLRELKIPRLQKFFHQRSG
eukprot:TRINITY_DN4293_c0_g2_i1.p1 TRINITY_DN4293_c0_g2~~TRINITY_DN4293_c0_g2_i1.p1  ORF type:complete len:352 (-),score=76.70 TRINITY_DN4293_c0_g2_i1:382-1437(-)